MAGSGIAAALAALGVRGAAPAGEGDAGDLFGEFECQDAPQPLAPKGRSGPKGGRPVGARNKSTEEFVRYFLSKYRSPLTVAAEIYSRPLNELVDELQAMADKHKKWRETKEGGYWSVVQIDPGAVLKLQKEAAMAVAPYIHKQQPKALEIDQRAAGLMILGEIDDASTVGDDDLALPLPPGEDNQ